MALSAVLLLLLLQDDVQTHFDHGLALIQEHQDEAAIAEFRQTLELKPGLYEADLNLGILLLRNHRAAEALPVLKEATELKPAEPRPPVLYAQALLDAGKLDEAAERYRVLANKDGIAQVGTAYEKAGDAAHALAIYKELQDNAGIKRLYLAAADAANEAKQPAKAMEFLQLALGLDPKDFDLRMAYGRMLRDQHNLMPAAQQFYAAAQLQPDSAPAWNELASALIVGEKYAEGLAALDRVRALGKEIAGDMYLRAITLDKLKQKPQAVAAYRQFLSADNGAHPDQEFLSRQRVRIIESELKR